jgi:hypothetical protein
MCATTHQVHFFFFLHKFYSHIKPVKIIRDLRQTANHIVYNPDYDNSSYYRVKSNS